MLYIDPHIHMVLRITDDYVRLVRAGCVAVVEPAFWAGFEEQRLETMMLPLRPEAFAA